VNVGLRIDVDTYRGTKVGVPALNRILAARGIHGTYFFSLGPDNMGRHLWRLRRPSFLWKMLRSNALGLYGWDILLRGTFWPGPVIGEALAPVIAEAAAAGHEIGLHAWDHHGWQSHLDDWSEEQIGRQLQMGVELLTSILGRPPTCSAAPAWMCNESALRRKKRFPFQYNSDCRGYSVFVPVAQQGSEAAGQPQIPVTLPTYDEMVGRAGVTSEGYYQRVLDLLDPQELNILAIHAEVEGVALRGPFEEFLDAALAKGCSFTPLGSWLREPAGLPACRMEKATMAGREGWVSRQAESDKP